MISDEQRAEIIEIIEGLKGKEKINLCEKCHEMYGCGRKHGINMFDTGVCDSCGEVNDVVNCIIVNSAEILGIGDLSYWLSGLPRIFERRVDDESYRCFKIHKS